MSFRFAPLAALALLSATPAVAEGTSKAQAFGGPEDQRALITGVCLNQSGLGRAGCLCLADKALVDLETDERDYLLATVLVPPTAERMAGKLGQDGLKKVALFLNEASVFCEKPENQPTVSDVPVSQERAPAAVPAVPAPASPRPQP